jgi:hypothetical protein
LLELADFVQVVQVAVPIDLEQVVQVVASIVVAADY